MALDITCVIRQRLRLVTPPLARRARSRPSALAAEKQGRLAALREGGFARGDNILDARAGDDRSEPLEHVPAHAHSAQLELPV